MPNDPVLVDTGVLAALFDPNDQHHDACVLVAQQLPVGKAYTCWPVITEAAYLLRRYPAKRDALLESVQTGEFQLLLLTDSDISFIRELMAKYHDQEIDLADVCLLQLANREDIETVFTVDRRHFAIFRKVNGKPLRLVPGE